MTANIVKMLIEISEQVALRCRAVADQQRTQWLEVISGHCAITIRKFGWQSAAENGGAVAPSVSLLCIALGIVIPATFVERDSLTFLYQTAHSIARQPVTRSLHSIYY